jgi:hypothetical protein
MRTVRRRVKCQMRESDVTSMTIAVLINDPIESVMEGLSSLCASRVAAVGPRDDA